MLTFTTSPTSQEDVAGAYRAAKLRRVEKQEAEWVEELQALQARRGASEQGQGGAAPSSAAVDAAPGGGGGGMLKAVIDTVIGNLQLSITNVHVRYEDAVTNPGRPFAVGWTLERISGNTVDEAGREAFVTNNPLQLLRKVRGVVPGGPWRLWRERACCVDRCLGSAGM